jgi:hypothetical protein
VSRVSLEFFNIGFQGVRYRFPSLYSKSSQLEKPVVSNPSHFLVDGNAQKNYWRLLLSSRVYSNIFNIGFRVESLKSHSLYRKSSQLDLKTRFCLIQVTFL